MSDLAVVTGATVSSVLDTISSADALPAQESRHRDFIRATIRVDNDAELIRVSGFGESVWH